MNFGLITSYIIGGMILLSMLAMNLSLSSNSTELSLTQITRSKAANVADLIASDIQKIGYNRSDKTSSLITIAERDKIQFHSNIDNSNDESVETITWEFTNTPLTTGKNPNAYVLKRTVRDLASGSIVSETDIKLGVTSFSVGYYDNYGEPVSDSLSTPVTGANLSNIKQLYISLRLESGEAVLSNPSSAGRYVPAVWEKRFSPPNLEF